MKRILFNIILLFFTIYFASAQYVTTNLDANIMGVVVEGGDTLGYDTISGAGHNGYKLYKYIGAIDSNYIECAHGGGYLIINGYKDTVPLSFFGQIGSFNYNFGDTLYNYMSEKELTIDNKIYKPRRIQRLLHYSTSLTGSDSTQNANYVGSLGLTSGMVVVDSSGNGDYTSILSGIAGAVISDTVIIKEGTYVESASTFFSKQLVIIAVGFAEYKTSTTQTYSLNIQADNSEVHGLFVNGNGVNSNGIYINQRGGNLIDGCSFKGHTSRAVYNRGADLSDTNTIKNCLFFGSPASTSIDNRTTNYYIIDNCSVGKSGMFSRDEILMNGYIGNIGYNKSNTDYASNTYVRTRSSNVNIYYNNFYSDTLGFFVDDYNIDVLKKEINIVGNDFEVNKSDFLGGFLNSDNDSAQYYIDNNIILINDTTNVIDVNTLQKFTLTNNHIKIIKGRAVDLTQDNITNREIIISGNIFDVINDPLDEISTVNIGNETDTILSNVEISNNVFRNSRYFNPASGGGHANLFTRNVSKMQIRNNYFSGPGIGGAIIKGYTGTSAGMHTDTYIYGNLFDEINIIVKGARNVHITNNTLYNTETAGIRIFREASLEDSDSAFIYNNIIYQSKSYTMYFDAESVDGLVSNYNLFYGNSDTVVYIEGIDAYTLTEWKSHGYDLNSYESDPHFKSIPNKQFWPLQPSLAIGNGYNFGYTYNVGLDISTIWPNNIINKNQHFKWSIGAYVVPLRRALTSNMKILILNNNYLKL